jgi:glycosyltransferase involved in cell wall biosynthesis
VLVRPDDPSALAVGIARALEQPGLGDAGRERGKREFSDARMADRTVALYESL